MPTLTRVISGDVDDLASVTLLTLVRTDTGAGVTIPGGGAFTAGSGGAWSITFTPPAAGLTYAYAYRRTFADGSHLDGAGTLVDGGASYAGRYTTETFCRTFIGDILKGILGTTDAAAGSEDSGAWQLSVVTAESLVDLMTNGPHDVTAGTPKASVFERWARVLACFEAYVRRGINDDKIGGDFRLLRDDVMNEMKAFRTGELNMPGDNATDGTGDDSLAYLRTLSPASARPTCGTPVRCYGPFDRRL